MNHYDDLQRFKDKTRNQKYEFKDLSAQNLATDHGSWAIMNQLSPASEESKLAMGGHVSLPQPQAVAPEVFVSNESQVSDQSLENHENSHENALPPASVEEPAVAAPSIFRDVAGQLASHSAAPATPAVREVSVPVSPAAASSAAVPADYSRLFAPKATEAKTSVEKNQPLQSLLERIASCR